MSTHKGHEEVIPAAIEKKMDVVLMSYNFTMGDRMEPLLASLHDAGVGVVAMKTQAGGRGEEARTRHERLVANGGMIAALRWALRTPNVNSTIPSITDNEQLEENIRAMASPFTEEDKQLLSAELDYIRPLYCRMCGSCEGTCRASCSGECRLPSVEAYCEGTCHGSCYVESSTDCYGTCHGTCVGTCSYDEGAECAGSCSGTCTGYCETRIEGSCSGECHGE